MPEILKRIDFDDIREGDTIRVIDVHDVIVTKKSDEEFRWGPGFASYLRQSPRPGAKRKFQLVERPRGPLPASSGSVIRVEGEAWVLTVRPGFDLLQWMNPATAFFRSQATMDSFAREFEVIL